MKQWIYKIEVSNGKVANKVAMNKNFSCNINIANALKIWINCILYHVNKYDCQLIFFH